MLAGYIDASNTHDDQGVLAVGACAASCAAWETWEDKWLPFLKDNGLDRWHHTDFLAKIKHVSGQPHQNWRYAEWLIARKTLCDIFQEIKPFCFGAAIAKKDYDVLKRRFDILPDDPYYHIWICGGSKWSLMGGRGFQGAITAIDLSRECQMPDLLAFSGQPS